MKTTTNLVESATGLFRDYKKLADRAIAQVSDAELFIEPAKDANSIAIVMKHLYGNMMSRWTDFLTTDGEKEWRNRDSEFELSDADSKEALMALWEKGWTCLFDTLASLDEHDLSKTITIRTEPHSVLEAINRQIAHYSYHVGQIVFIAKIFRSDNWQSLTIPKGKSNEFNAQMKKQ